MNFKALNCYEDLPVHILVVMKLFMATLQYGVHSDKDDTGFTEERSADEAGNINGENTVDLPDGRIQDVVFHAYGNYGVIIMDKTYQDARF